MLLGSELAGSELAGVEVAGSEVLGTEVAGSELLSEAAGTDVVPFEDVAALDVPAEEVLGATLVAADFEEVLLPQAARARVVAARTKSPNFFVVIVCFLLSIFGNNFYNQVP